MNVERLIRGDNRAGRLIHATVQHQPERAVGAILGEQDDRLGEIRVEHLRHGHQQNRGEGCVRHAFDTNSLRPSAVSPRPSRAAAACASGTNGDRRTTSALIAIL
jgi:hypothetical protein